MYVFNSIFLCLGGGGGLAKHMAVTFAKCGSTVVLWDVDKGIATINK